MKSRVRAGLIVLVVLISAACRGVDDGSQNATPDLSGLTAYSTSTGDGSRDYRLFVPPGLGAEPVAAVVLLHGHGGSARQVIDERGRVPSSHWLEIAERDGLVLVIPDGAPGPDGKQGWNDCRADAETNPETDDVAFIEQIVDEVGQKVRLDRTAIFATGLSNGGHFSLRLAIERPDLVAGIGAVAAAMPGNSECAAPTEPVAVLLMNGTDDPLLPFFGGEMAFNRGLVLGATESVAVWTDLADGMADGAPILFPDIDTGDGSTVAQTTYVGHKPVSLYIIEGGGHSEPSRSERHRRFWTEIVGPQNHDIEMADEIWAFFQAGR